MQIHELTPPPEVSPPEWQRQLRRFVRAAGVHDRIDMRVALEMQDRDRARKLLENYSDAAILERKKKKKRKAAKRTFKYGRFGGWWYPGFHDDSGASTDAGGDGGGESVREASTPDGVSPSTQMFLNEAEKTGILKDFITRTMQRLRLADPPKVIFHKNSTWAEQNRSFGQFDPDSNTLHVSLPDRHVMDIMRTIAHELTHAKQNEQHTLPDTAGETGSTWENSANAMAGIIMRDMAQENPDLFEADLSEGVLNKAAAAAALSAALAMPAGAQDQTQDPEQQRGPTIGQVLGTALRLYGISRIREPQVRAEVEQEFRNYLRAQQGDPNAQNQSEIYQWEREQRRVDEASGYIPTQKQRHDPRFKTALTVDIKPGQTGREANKLALDTDAQGRPGLLTKKLANALKEFKEQGSLTQPTQGFTWTDYSDLPMHAVMDLAETYFSRGIDLLESNSVQSRQYFQDLFDIGTDPEIGETYLMTLLILVNDRVSVAQEPTKVKVVRKTGPDQYAVILSDGSTVRVPYNSIRDRVVFHTWFFEDAQQYDRLRAALALKFESNLPPIAEKTNPISERCWTGYRQKGMKKKGDRRVPNCVPVEEDQELVEVDMSPGALKRWAQSEAAQRVRVGFEFEMYFPNTTADDSDDDDPYDYDYDRAAGSIQDVIDFFSEGNNPLGRGTLNRLEAQMYDQYSDWRQEMIDEEMTESGFFEFMDEMDETEDIRTDKQTEFRLEAEEELGDEAGRDEISDRAQELWVDWVDTQWNRGDSVYMEQYRDQVADSLEENFGEEAWLQSEYRYMSDVANEWSLDWPHMNERYREGGQDPETWAEELSQVIGMPVKTGGYHGTRRGEDHANLEYDSSLDSPEDSDDAGLELITPYRPLPEALQILDSVIEFANRMGIYTNSSTGLHMNVSLEDVPNVDWVKLVLFMGDTYILDTFERRANTYARSSMMKLMDKVREKRAEQPVQEQDADQAIYGGQIDIDRAMRLMRDNMIELARQAVQSGLGRDKYQSVHVKPLNDGGSYIEFRGPGGDWLGKQDENADVLRNTVFRLGRAMEIAADPEAERREYGKKLYKALTPEMPQLRSAMQLFAQYSAGDISREQLKREWAEAVLQAERAAVAKSRDREAGYKIVDRGTGEVLDRYEAGSDSEALEYAMSHWAGRGINYDIRREVDRDKEFTAKERSRQDLARRVAGKPTWWRVSVIGRPKYTGWIQAPTAARAIQDYERRMNIEGNYNRTTFDTRVEEPPPLRDEPMPDAVKNLSVRPESWFPRRSNWALVTANGEVDETFAAPDREAAMDRLRSWQNEPDKPDTPRWVVPIEQEPAAQPQPQPTTATSINQPGEGDSDWRVVWSEYRDRNGREELVQDSTRVVAASAQAASLRMINALRAQGRDPFNVNATPTDPPPWRQNIAPAGQELAGGAPGARIVNDPRQPTQQRPLEFTGRWLVRSTVTGETVHTISGIGNVQADANRHAARWAQSTGFDDGIEVVPEMG